jgi:hypothetical protein
MLWLNHPVLHPRFQEPKGPEKPVPRLAMAVVGPLESSEMQDNMAIGQVGRHRHTWTTSVPEPRSIIPGNYKVPSRGEVTGKE